MHYIPYNSFPSIKITNINFKKQGGREQKPYSDLEYDKWWGNNQLDLKLHILGDSIKILRYNLNKLSMVVAIATNYFQVILFVKFYC